MSVCSIVKDEAITGQQSILGEWTVLCYQGDLYVTSCIGHLTERQPFSNRMTSWRRTCRRSTLIPCRVELLSCDKHQLSDCHSDHQEVLASPQEPEQTTKSGSLIFNVMCQKVSRSPLACAGALHLHHRRPGWPAHTALCHESP